jgi:fucose permease
VEKSFNIYNASLIVVLFWVGILAGRLIISVLSYKFKAGALLIALSAISLAGLAIVISPFGGYNQNGLGINITNRLRSVR